VKLLNLKMSLLVIVAVVIFGQTVWADTTPSYDWTGFYAGAHFGGGFGNGDTHATPLFKGHATHDTVIPSTLNPDPGGVTGGGQFGYNLQRGSFVFGIEADFSGSAISGAATVKPITLDGILRPRASITSQEDVSWFGTLRPRLSYTPIPPLLLYGTGGLAYGHASYSADTTFPTVQYPALVGSTGVGWTVGAGAEYAIDKRWSVKAEYLYIDLGSESAIANPIPPNPPFQSEKDWNTAFHVVSIGINFKF
jgi:outer membrane immunogenic protein